MIDIPATDSDDPIFLDIVKNLVVNLLNQNEPANAWIVKIDRAFDAKWRGFQGKMLGALGWWDRNQLKVPPFIPDRVIDQSCYERVGEEYLLMDFGVLHYYQPSSENITGRNALQASVKPRLFLWFSGETISSKRGTVMVYLIENYRHSSFLVSMVKKTKDWEVYKTDGISRNEFLALAE
ncbi:MAG: hypothetical protein ACT4O9_08995 [Blastocatellia bacterium]